MGHQYLFIEGMDRCGKNTLIRNLRKYITDRLVMELHFGSVNLKSHDAIQYGSNLYRNMFDMLDMYDRTYSEPTLFCMNRSHISEAVYSPLYRGYSGDYVFDIERKFANKPFWKQTKLFLLINSDYKALQDRDDGESFDVSTEALEREYLAFHDASQRSNIQCRYIIDIKNQTPDEVFHYVKHILQLNA